LCFINQPSFSIIRCCLLQFNGTLAFYGLVFAAYSISHFLACLAFGWLADRRPIKELLAAVCANAVLMVMVMVMVML
jgi:MFS family permease